MKYIRVNRTRLRRGLPAISVRDGKGKVRYVRSITLPRALVVQKAGSVWMQG